MRKAAAVVLIAAIVAVLWLSLRPSTPARTFDAFELKAKDTAESVLSSVETARLGATTGANGRAFGPYVSVLLSESERAAGEADASFSGLQPPDARADRLRTRLTAIVDDAENVLGDLRISARRGELEGLEQQARPLGLVSRRLERFLEDHG